MGINATLAAQVFHFLLLLFLLRIFAYRPFLKVLDERRRLVGEHLAAAERDREESRDLLQQQKKMFAEARERAGAIVARAESEADRRTREILAQARAETENLKARAAAAIDRERDEARSVLRAELADLTLAVTRKVIGEVVDREQHLRLVTDAVREVDRQWRIRE